jgi:hypothetical protein
MPVVDDKHQIVVAAQAFGEAQERRNVPNHLKADEDGEHEDDQVLHDAGGIGADKGQHRGADGHGDERQ